MAMTNAQLENKLRNECLELLRKTFDGAYGCDVLAVSASELALPVTDAEGGERFIVVKVTIPRGTRNGNGGYDPYDGYAVAEDYELTCQEKEDKKKASEARKKAKIAQDEKKRAEKKAVAEARKNITELRNIPLDKKEDK